MDVGEYPVARGVAAQTMEDRASTRWKARIDPPKLFSDLYMHTRHGAHARQAHTQIIVKLINAFGFAHVLHPDHSALL